MSSLVKKLSKMLTRRKLGVYFICDIALLAITFSIFFLGCRYYASLEHQSDQIYSRLDQDNDIRDALKREIDIGFFHTVGYFADNSDRVNGLITYELYSDTTNEVFLRLPVFNWFIAGCTATLLLFLVQCILCNMGSLFERHRIRGVLRPIDEIAEQADRLAHLEFDMDKYHVLEEKITSLNPEDSLPVTSGDRDLQGIETAINNLLQRLRESYMQQTRFVNDASHELRTPIAVIEGYSNMLARWGREDEKVLDESIQAIRHESAHMKYLVDQLLFLARGDSGRTVLHCEVTDLKNLMRETYEESLMIDENHVYRFSAPDDEVQSYCDPALMKQAVRILIDNAVKFTPEKNDIVLSVGLTESARPYLQVQDTGCGMSDDDIIHMFERFYRAPEARSINGTGLGLSIAKWIVDKHDGHFETISRPELGTRIRIVL